MPQLPLRIAAEKQEALDKTTPIYFGEAILRASPKYDDDS
jgi:hypothetical protein